MNKRMEQIKLKKHGRRPNMGEKESYRRDGNGYKKKIKNIDKI